MRVPELGIREEVGRHRRRDRDAWRVRSSIAGLTAVLLFVPAPSLTDLPPPIHAKIEGFVQPLPEGMTVGAVARIFRIRPRSGALLDVEGVPLERGRYPGHYRLNERRADLSDVIGDGDVLKVVDGKDRVEPYAIETRRIPEGRIDDPQSHLGTTPGKQVITRGARSGKLVSTVFRPSGPTDSPDAVALTFDDGPSPLYTLRILRILRRYNVPATFFTVGYLVRRHPDIVRALNEAGMELANHSLSHPQSPPFASLPRDQIRSEVRAGARALEEIGIEPRLFRPPGGSWDGDVLEIVRDAGQRTVVWSIDSRDWTGLSSQRIVREVMANVGPGSIILMHDGGGNRTQTIRALPTLIRRIRARGLAFSLI